MADIDRERHDQDRHRDHVSHRARREAVMAVRHQLVPGEGHPKLWQPWEKLIKEAEQRMRVEVSAALKDYEADLTAAGGVLDLAEVTAREAGDAITRTAYAALAKQLEAAADAVKAIIEPARQAYDRETTRAADDFAGALDVARGAYERAIRDAQQAQQLASHTITAA